MFFDYGRDNKRGSVSVGTEQPPHVILAQLPASESAVSVSVGTEQPPHVIVYDRLLPGVLQSRFPSAPSSLHTWTIPVIEASLSFRRHRAASTLDSAPFDARPGPLSQFPSALSSLHTPKHATCDRLPKHPVSVSVGTEQPSHDMLTHKG